MSDSAAPLVNLIQANHLSVLDFGDVATNRVRITAVEGGGLALQRNGVAYGWLGGLKQVVAKTADYSVVAADLGKWFTNRGAGGAVVFTLPATAGGVLPSGWNCMFFVAADQTLTVASATSDTITAFNDLTADSIAFSTGSEKIGGSVEMVWDGTGWLANVGLGIETQTPVIAT